MSDETTQVAETTEPVAEETSQAASDDFAGMSAEEEVSAIFGGEDKDPDDSGNKMFEEFSDEEDSSAEGDSPSGDDDSAEEGSGTEDASEASADDDSRKEEASSDPITSELFVEAAKLGFPEAIAKKFGTATELIGAMAQVKPQAGKDGKTEASDTPGETGTESEGKKAAAPSGKFELKFEEEDADDEVVKVVTAMNDHYHEQIKSLQDQLGAAQSRDQDRQSQAIVSEYDKHFERLGQDDLFGSGPTLGLDRNSPEFQRRINLMEFGENQVQMMKQMKHKIPNDDDLVDGMFNTLHPGRIERQATKKIAKTMRSRSKSSVPSPSGSAAKKGEESHYDAEVRRLKSEGKL